LLRSTTLSSASGKEGIFSLFHPLSAQRREGRTAQRIRGELTLRAIPPSLFIFKANALTWMHQLKP